MLEGVVSVEPYTAVVGKLGALPVPLPAAYVTATGYEALVALKLASASLSLIDVLKMRNMPILPLAFQFSLEKLLSINWKLPFDAKLRVVEESVQAFGDVPSGLHVRD